MSLLVVGLAITACQSTKKAVDASEQPPDDEVDAGKAECLPEGTTRACTCASGTQGKKTCKNGVYGACTNCVERRGDAGRSPASGTLPRCKAGYYAGNLQGKYKPGFTGFGLSMGGIEVELMGQGTEGRPPLSLSIEETSNELIGEFSTYTVGDGCIQGIARSMGTDNPFAARITGDLDCNTGKFTGVMEGLYTLLGFDGFDFTFKGEITAQFEPTRAELGEGAWTVYEPAALDGNPAGGGSGSWNAVWSAERAPDAGAAADPCAKVVSTGPLDAGVAPRSDAGP